MSKEIGSDLLRALLLQVLYTIRSERLLMEQLDYNLLFRWFVGLEMDDPIWNPTVFTKNRERLLAGEIARAFFDRVVAQARERDRKSTRLNSSHGYISYAVFCLKKKKKNNIIIMKYAQLQAIVCKEQSNN